MGTNAKSIRIRIPGVWMDAWLYKGALVLWSPVGEIRAISLDEIRASLVRVAGKHVGVAADYLIFRNDWKASAQFNDLMGIKPVRDGLFGAIRTASSITFELPHLHERSTGTEPHEGYLLDTAVYGNRVFSATESGVFETEFNPEYPDSTNPTVQIHDRHVSSVEAYASTIAISAGDSGLLKRNIEFGYGAAWASHVDGSPLELIDDFSLHSSFSSYNILNYRGAMAPSFLRAQVRHDPPSGTDKYARAVVSRYERPALIEGAVHEHFRKRVASSRSTENPDNVSPSNLADVEVIGNSNYHLLVRSGTDTAILNVSAFDGKPVEVKYNSAFGRDESRLELASRALTTQALRSGFLVETFDSTGLITQKGSYVLIDEPRVRIRSFPKSKRHDDMFIAIGDDFVELVGFTDLPIGS